MRPLGGGHVYFRSYRIQFATGCQTVWAGNLGDPYGVVNSFIWSSDHQNSIFHHFIFEDRRKNRVLTVARQNTAKILSKKKDFLKVCWLWFLCFCCCFGCYFCLCCCSEAVSQYSRSASVLRQFLNVCAAYFKEGFECSRSASGLMQILNARVAHVF